jgi:hypothetical protein
MPGQQHQTYAEYYDEPSGRRRRRSIDEVEYVVRHGEIVSALCRRRRQNEQSNERVVKNSLIDLGIEVDGVLTELYEIKTNCRRQTLYTGIGQIVVHDKSSGGECERYLVVPSTETISPDITRAIERANIYLLRYELRGDSIRIV